MADAMTEERETLCRDIIVGIAAQSSSVLAPAATHDILKELDRRREEIQGLREIITRMRIDRGLTHDLVVELHANICKNASDSEPGAGT